jgi:hypothetical protein
MYKPKKKKYNDLCSLNKEMKEASVSTTFNGAAILTKSHVYTLCDSIVKIKER